MSPKFGQMCVAVKALSWGGHTLGQTDQA
jgi:hypothetical protein